MLEADSQFKPGVLRTKTSVRRSGGCCFLYYHLRTRAEHIAQAREASLGDAYALAAPLLLPFCEAELAPSQRALRVIPPGPQRTLGRRSDGEGGRVVCRPGVRKRPTPDSGR